MGYSKYFQKHLYPHHFDADGREATKNNMGYMHTLSAYSVEFIQFASCFSLPALDIGCAYGVATIPALELGVDMYAIDLDQRHLDILKSRVDTRLKDKLTLLHGSFPENFNFPENKFSAILMSRIFTFLTPEQIKNGLQKVYNWLAPGGKIFLVNHSPYIKKFENYLAEYESRKTKGDPYPGLITNLKNYPELYNTHQLPETINVMDKDIYEREFKKIGFTIEKLEYFHAPEIEPAKTIALDGRELIGGIMKKPE